MITKMFSVKDRAADAFGRPFFCSTDGIAVRSFMDEVNREAADNQLYQHPDDFDLFVIGSFDDSTGAVESFTPQLLMLGKQVRSAV